MLTVYRRQLLFHKPTLLPGFAFRPISIVATEEFINQRTFLRRLDQHERLKSSLTAAGLVWRQENHPDKLREGRDEVNEDQGEERPEAIPDRKVDCLERNRHCGNECYSVEEELVHRLHVSTAK